MTGQNLLLTAAAGLAGWWIWDQYFAGSAAIVPPAAIAEPVPLPPDVAPPVAILCTQEMRLCADGVPMRRLPNCEWDAGSCKAPATVAAAVKAAEQSRTRAAKAVYYGLEKPAATAAALTRVSRGR